MGKNLSKVLLLVWHRTELFDCKHSSKVISIISVIVQFCKGIDNYYLREVSFKYPN